VLCAMVLKSTVGRHKRMDCCALGCRKAPLAGNITGRGLEKRDKQDLTR
jgi:hypothetical protein